MPTLIAMQAMPEMRTVFHWSAKSLSLMVVPMCTSSMETRTPETSSSVESSNIVFGSISVQKPIRNMTEDRNSIETMALVFVATISPIPKTSRITNVARIGSIKAPPIIFPANPPRFTENPFPGFMRLMILQFFHECNALNRK